MITHHHFIQSCWSAAIAGSLRFLFISKHKEMTRTKKVQIKRSSSRWWLTLQSLKISIFLKLYENLATDFRWQIRNCLSAKQATVNYCDDLWRALCCDLLGLVSDACFWCDQMLHHYYCWFETALANRRW